MDDSVIPTSVYKNRLEKLQFAQRRKNAAGKELEDVVDTGHTQNAAKKLESAKTLVELRGRLVGKNFDYDDPVQSISLSFLRNTHRTKLTSMLFVNRGKITKEMILNMGTFFGLSIPPSLVTAEYMDDVESAIREQKNEEKNDSEQSSGDEETDESQPKISDLENLPCSAGKMKEIIWILKRELRDMYQDCLKSEQEKVDREILQEKNVEIPIYKKQQTIPITTSVNEFNRLRERRLLGGSSSVNKSVALRISMPATVPTNTVIDEIASTTVAPTFVGEAVPWRLTVHRPSSVVSDSSTQSKFLSQQDPSVFQHFYPSEPPPSALRLPIATEAQEIMAMLNTRKVTIISGMTGTGKTTQVPMMVMDECARRRGPCNIIVTQPRKLAAIGVAQRVCAERKWKIGQLVGYHVGLDRKATSSTRLTYCTTGVFVERIVAAKHLNEYTHVFLDEVHERGQDTDLSLMLVRQMMKENSADVKVILMSATVEVGKLSDYFQLASDNFNLENVPGQIHISQPCYNVQELFLEEITNEPIKIKFDIVEPAVSYKLLQLAADCLGRLHPIVGDNSQGISSVRPAVLIFLPGLEHITEMADVLQKTEARLDVRILHSTVSREEQLKVLEPLMENIQRVILATNIAESSITIPYIDYGRVGRVRPGCVYYFVPRKFFTEGLPPHPEPEIKVAPLENAVLRVKLLGVDSSPAQVLALLPDPPRQNDVDLAVLNLKEVGALTIAFDGEPTYADGDLTAIGQLMAYLPVDIRVSRFLAICAMFGFAQEGVTIAAGMTVDSPFACYGSSEHGFTTRMHELYNRGAHCDALAMLYAFQDWCQMSFSSREEERSWCQAMLTESARLKEMAAVKKELWCRLQRRGIVEVRSAAYQLTEKLLPILFAGAFYPNILVNTGCIDDIVNGRMLQGYDPLRTCIIPHFGHATSQQAPLYDGSLRKRLNLDESVQVVYGSQQTYICYPRTTNSREVMTPHVGLVELRANCEKRRVVSMDALRSNDILNELVAHAVEGGGTDCRISVDRPEMLIHPHPGLMGTENIPVILADITSARCFWLGIWDGSTQRQQMDMMETLDKLPQDPNFIPVDPRKARIGGAYISYNAESNQVARIILLGTPDVNSTVKVLLPDQGLYDRIPVNWLHVLPKIVTACVPRGCFEFSFAGLRFSARQDEEAIRFLKTILLTDDAELSMKIFSVLDGAVRGELFLRSPATNGVTMHLNKELLLLGFAHVSNESWISRFDAHRRSTTCLENLPTVDGATGVRRCISTPLPDRIAVGPLLFPALSKMKTLGRSPMPANIDQGSLNAFPYDPNPQDQTWPYRAVAAAKLLHPAASDERLKAVVTSALPVQPGLVGIISLLFAPRVALSFKDDRLVGALTGLGPIPGHAHSFYEDGEIQLVFDGDFKQEDLAQINMLRLAMNDFLRRVRGDHEITQTLEVIQETCRSTLVRLVDKIRSCVPFHATWQKFQWDNDEAITANMDENFRAAELIFLTPIVVRNFEKEDTFTANALMHRKALQRMEEVSKKVKSTASLQTTSFCEACQVHIRDVDRILDHLQSERHHHMEAALVVLKDFDEAIVPFSRI